MRHPWLIDRTDPPAERLLGLGLWLLSIALSSIGVWICFHIADGSWQSIVCIILGCLQLLYFLLRGSGVCRDRARFESWMLRVVDPVLCRFFDRIAAKFRRR